MTFFRLFTIFLLSLRVAGAVAQKYENSFILPGTESGKDVAELSDGSIVSVGISNSYGSGGTDMFVMKTNVSGVILWIRYFGGTGDDGANTVAVSPENEIYAAGYKTTGTNRNGFVVKLNAAGATIWTKTYGAGTSDEIKDCGYRSARLYFVGATNGAGAGGNDAWFLKTDTAGTIIKNKTLGTTGSEAANACTFTSDGNFAIAGQTSGYNDSTVYVAKLNLSGDTVWTRHYDLRAATNTSTVAARGIAELTTQELLVTGIGWDGPSGYSSTFHLKLNTSGTTVFTKWTSLIADEGSDVVAGKNGAYYVLLNYSNFGTRAYLAKFDNGGNLLLSAQYGYPGGSSYGNFTAGARIKSISAGRLLLVGTSSLYNYNADVWLARVDSNGVAYTTTAPVISAVGSSTICSGNSVLLKAPAGFANYSWGKMLQGNISFLNTDNDTVYASAAGTYFCVCWTGNSYRISNLITLTVNTSPTAAIIVTGSKSFCAAAGDSVKLSVATANITSFQWRRNNIPISGANTSIYYTKTSGSYTVATTNSCGTSISSAVDVNANAIPDGEISCTGDCFAGSSCAGPTGNLVVPAENGASYYWALNGNPYSEAGNSILPAYSGYYTCTTTNACGSFQSTAYYINSYSSVLGIVGNALEYTNPINGCGIGSSVSIDAPVGSTGPYTWYLNGIVIPGAVSSGLVATQTGGYSVSFYNPTCNSQMTTPAEMVVLNTPNATVTAPNGNTACAGTVLLNASPTGNPNNMYEWYKDNVLIAGATTSSYTASVSGTYKCRVYNPVCGWDYSNAQVVSIGTPTPSITSTAGTICSQGSAVFNCSPNSSPTYSYQWYRNGAPIANAISSQYTTNLGGTIHCNITNSCATVPSSALSLVVKPTPVATIYTPASTHICLPQTLTLKAAKSPGATYSWYRNGTFVGSSLDTVYTVNSSGNYTVVVSDTSCSSSSATVVVTSATGPSAAVVTSGYPQICSGEMFPLKAVSNASYTYQWRKNGANINGAVDSIYNATAAGTYSVVVTNSCGSISSKDYPLIVKTKPSATITPSGPVTFCLGDSVTLQTTTGSGYTYYWKKNGTLIPGAFSPAYAAKQQGYFKAGVYSQFGCLKESPTVQVIVPCREGEGLETAVPGFDIYPNPTSNRAELVLRGLSSVAEAVFYFTDITGRTVDMKPEFMEDRVLLSPPYPGVYLVTVVSGAVSETKRLVRVD